MDAVNRTFVGIPVPWEVSEQIQQNLMLIKKKPGIEVRWSAPSEYLIQLSSLGELSPTTIQMLGQALPAAVAQFPRFRLEVTGFGGTPNLIQPRFAHAELKGDVHLLEQIAQAIDLAAARCVPAREMRGFRPHIPIGRLKSESEPLRVALGRALKMTQVPEMGSIEVDSVTLFVSRATDMGTAYDAVGTFPLGVA
jgi:RNA 2',3'-cyclic 3'-phosphodiesterase